MKIQKEITVHQHVVPQTWLKRFTYNTKKSSVYVYEKSGGKKCGSKNISKIAGFEHFYDFHEEIFKELRVSKVFDESDVQYVEKKFFSYNIENKLGELLKVVIDKIEKETDGKDILDNDERISLSIHIAIQYFRSNLMRQFVTKILNAINLYAKDTGIKDLMNNPEKEKEFFHFLLLNNSEVIQDFAINLFKRQWTFYKTKSCLPFVISDNPIAFQKVKSGGVNVIVPLSQNYILAMYDKKFPEAMDNTLVELNANIRSTVDDYNNLQYHQCDKEIYSSINNFDWIESENKTFIQGLSPVGKIPDQNFKDYVAAIIESKKDKSN